MIRFIHTGDIHLGLQFSNVSFHKTKAIKRRRELWSTFERIVDYTKEKKADFLFIAGDLFEERYFTLGHMKRVRDILGKIIETNVIIIAGNHDYLNENSLYNKVEWSPNVFIIKEKAIERIEFPDLNTVIYGYSWDKVEIRDNNIFDEFNYNDEHLKKILILHGDINSGSTYLPLKVKDLNRLNMDYIALGHIHKPEIITKNMAYCGCPEPLDFGEVGERGFIEGIIGKEDTSIEFIPFSKRRFWNQDIIINEDMSYLDIVNMFEKLSYGKKNMDFYRINLKGYIQSDIDTNDLFKSLEDKFYHLEVVDNTIPDYDLDALEAAYENNIIGGFIRAMKDKGIDDPIIKDGLYMGLEALLKGQVDL